MDIIALIGPSRCGKSTTLNIAYSRLLQRRGISTNRQVLGAIEQNDFSDIVLWGERKIAFFTMGDYSRVLVNAIREHSSQDIDILICACNDRFVHPIVEIEKHTHIIINKVPEIDKDRWLAVNSDIAEQVLNRL